MPAPIVHRSCNVYSEKKNVYIAVCCCIYLVVIQMVIHVQKLMTHNYAWQFDITTYSTSISMHGDLHMQASCIHIVDYLCPSDDQERMIYQGMKHWEDNTCIRFKPRTNQRTYVNFFPGSHG